MVTLREMTEEDYEGVFALWNSIRGFVIRDIDDSREGVTRFLRRNPSTSVVAMSKDRIVGAILCGHDGRRGCLYHVCVSEDYRKQGIGQKMVSFCIEALRRENICKVNIIAFCENDIGNRFWQEQNWIFRKDLNYYDFTINTDNVTHRVS